MSTESNLSRPADAIVRTVTGLGYDLVDVERLARGLLRVTIDRLPGQSYGVPGALDDGEFITVDDCERVTRQLQLALEVAGVDYARLEVSSPGLDRPLRTEAHCRRFAGCAVSLALKQPLDGRKHWSGVLQPQEPPASGWRLLVAAAEPEARPRRAKQAAGTKAAGTKAAGAKAADAEPATDLALDFQLDEVREIRLVPVLDFKGRQRPQDARNAAPAADAALNGEQDQ